MFQLPTNLALLHVQTCIDILYIDWDLYGTVILQNERVAMEDGCNRNFGVEQFFWADEFQAVDPSPF